MRRCLRLPAHLHPRDRLDDAPRRHGRDQQLGAEAGQRIVDGVGDGGGRGDGAALADALLAEARVGRRRLHVQDADLRHLGGAGQQVVGERGGQRLGLRVEAHLLVERRADALRRAAPDLAVDDHRVDQRAAVLDHDVVEDLELAGLGIDGDDGGMRRIAERAGVALGLVARLTSRPPGSTSGGRSCGRRYQVRATSATAMRPDGPTTSPASRRTSSGLACSRPAPIFSTRAASSSQAAATAPPAMIMQREPQVPVE